MQNQFSSWTKQLADHFLINSSDIQNPGLYNGKTGAAICLFQYYRISGKEEYENCARDLISQLFELIPSRLPLNFENGLTGIAWGMEYLFQNGFIGTEKNIILNEIDKRLFVAILKSRTLMNNTGIYGAGIYFVQRLKNYETNLFEKNKIQLAMYLRDDIERLLSRNTKFIFNIPVLNLEQVNSIVYFYLEMMKYKFITVSTERLLDYLICFTENLKVETFDIIDIHTLCSLLEEMSANLTDTSGLGRVEVILNKL